MFLISSGRLFHSSGAADWKARSPSVGRHRALADTNRVALLELRLATFRLEYEDDYEYKFKVLSTRTSKIFALQA